MKKILVALISAALLLNLPVYADVYEQHGSSPSGLSYLSGDIMPWEDYIIFRSSEDVSVAVYGQADEDGFFKNATVRTVSRQNNYGNYYTNEYQESNVSVRITEPYYCYSNIYGVSYSLPSSQNILCMIVAAFFALLCLISVFRLVWSFRKGVGK